MVYNLKKSRVYPSWFFPDEEDAGITATWAGKHEAEFGEAEFTEQNWPLDAHEQQKWQHFVDEAKDWIDQQEEERQQAEELVRQELSSSHMGEKQRRLICRICEPYKNV